MLCRCKILITFNFAMKYSARSKKDLLGILQPGVNRDLTQGNVTMTINLFT